MPMPPVINPYDPRKKGPTPATQPAGQQPVQAQPAAPVQSSLPSMQQPQQAPAQQPVAQAGQPQQTSQAQQRKPAVPVTYQQQAGAVADPRFSQALAQKLQQDVAAKQAALQQQQAQFQEQLSQAAGGVPTQQRIGDLLSKITSGTASEAELGEYDKLQKLQYQGPTGLQGTANIAALSQLAGSPELLAQQYAGFAPGGVRPGDFAKAIAGLQKSPELTSAQQAATGLAEKAMSAEEIAAQQAGLLKSQTEAAREIAETGSKAAMAEVTGQISEQTKAEREAKESALSKLKEGLFLTGQVSKSDIRKLGLNPDDPTVQGVLQSLEGIDISNIEAKGISGVKTVKELEEKVKQIQNDLSAGNPVTEEEKKLAGAFSDVSGLTRELDETGSSDLSYAKKEDLVKINALRRLRGEKQLTESDIGKKLGGITQERLSNLTGRLRQGAEYSDKETIKQEKKVVEDFQKSNNELARYYQEIQNGDYSNKKLDSLDNWAKQNKGWNPHADWLYNRLQRAKGFFGWDTDFVRKLVGEQRAQVRSRAREYENQLNEIAKKEKERSATTRKVTLKD
jgi:hypothetical protein